jgi:hypothetical protein
MSTSCAFHEDEQRALAHAINASDRYCSGVGMDAGARVAPAAATCFYLRPEQFLRKQEFFMHSKHGAKARGQRTFESSPAYPPELIP